MKERTYDIGYFSSADRGLECLLDMIPEVEKKLGRKVKSVWAYGWNSFDTMHAKNPEKMKWKWQMIRRMNDVGMESKGRLSHPELAKLMGDVKVWAYPTEFTEIHCITALKAQEAGCIPVTTIVAALNETVTAGIQVKGDTIYTDEKQQDMFIDSVVKVLDNPSDYQSAPDVENRYWPDVAKAWDKVMA